VPLLRNKDLVTKQTTGLKEVFRTTDSKQNSPVKNNDCSSQANQDTRTLNGFNEDKVNCNPKNNFVKKVKETPCKQLGNAVTVDPTTTTTVYQKDRSSAPINIDSKSM